MSYPEPHDPDGSADPYYRGGYPTGQYPQQGGGYPTGSYPQQGGGYAPRGGGYPQQQQQPSAWPYNDQGTGDYYNDPPRRGMSAGLVAAIVAIVVILGLGAVAFLLRDKFRGDSSPSADASSTPAVIPTVATTTEATERTKYWAKTYQDAPGYSQPRADASIQSGTLFTGRHYFYCRTWGPIFEGRPGVWNHYWLLTDLDTGSTTADQWVSAYYLSEGNNDEAFDETRVDFPPCP